MITCSKCQKELVEGGKYCDFCGAPISETIYCPGCGIKTSTDLSNCPNCGISISEKSIIKQIDLNSLSKKEKSKLPRNLIALSIVIIVIVTVVIVINLTRSFKDNNYAIYLKDDEVFFSNLEKENESLALSSNLLEETDFGFEDLDIEEILDTSDYLEEYLYTSKDGNYIFYSDRFDENLSFDLCYKDINNRESDGILIDSQVIGYNVNEISNIVTYLTRKDETSELYQYNLENGSIDKIDNDVIGYAISENGEKLVYLTYDYTNADYGKIYLKDMNKEKEIVADSISDIIYLNDDLTVVYYMRGSNLYKFDEERGENLISEFVSDVKKIYETGEIYYTKSGEKTIAIKDYIIDDLVETDKLILEPVYPNYPQIPIEPDYWSYETYDEYSVAFEKYKAEYDTWLSERDRLDAEYMKAYEEYTKKNERDAMRLSLENQELSLYDSMLYYYDGTEEIVISDVFYDSYSYGVDRYGTDSYHYGLVADDTPIFLFKTYNQDTIDKIKFSEISDISEIQNMVRNSLNTNANYYIAVNSKVTLIEHKNEVSNIHINNMGNLIYYVEKITDESDYGTLYRISIENGEVGKPEVYDDDVYANSDYLINFINNNQIQYFKNFDGFEGELYIDKKLINTNVLEFEFTNYDSTDKFLYFTQWDSGNECGTLNVYQNNETEKISDYVSMYSIASDRSVLYLYDYNVENSRGELREWSAGKIRKINDNVQAIFYISDYKYKGRNYLSNLGL